jgi:hypothetical protein
MHQRTPARRSRDARTMLLTVKPPNRKKKRHRRSSDEGAYVCPTCGERIVIPLDPSGGTEQSYVEDCPVCCNPNVIEIEFFPDGEAPRVSATAE